MTIPRCVTVVLFGFATIPVPGSASEATRLLTSPTLQVWHKTKGGDRLLLYAERIPSPMYTLYYLEVETQIAGNRVRVWEKISPGDYRENSPDKLRGFFLAFDNDRSSSVALAFWEWYDLHFVQINPRRPQVPSFKTTIEQGRGKDRDLFTKLAHSYNVRYNPVVVPFSKFIRYAWSPTLDNPPRINRIWRTPGAWNIEIAYAMDMTKGVYREDTKKMELVYHEPPMHVQLRDGAKEWVWLNKP